MSGLLCEKLMTPERTKKKVKNIIRKLWKGVAIETMKEKPDPRDWNPQDISHLQIAQSELGSPIMEKLFEEYLIDDKQYDKRNT